MNLLLAVAIILPVFGGQHSTPGLTLPSLPVTIEAIPLPAGYARSPAPVNSFTAWLRNVPLKRTKTVYLYNGVVKRNQLAQFAVLDVSVNVGPAQDLQQCADAVMRLRAEYLYASHRWNEISFTDNAGKAYCYRGGSDRRAFENYLRNVFAWCGTASLARQLKTVKCMDEMQPGDVLIKGGFPGHAAIVMDVALDRHGKKIYLLAQSYMPAQDIHVLKNPSETSESPWYQITDNEPVVTPEWIFYSNQLKRW